MIHYQVKAQDPKAHLIDVTLTIPKPSQPYQTLRLPNWIPGSYLIRDFAKHLSSIKAVDNNGQSIDIESIDKSNWRFQATTEVTLNYQVYAWDLSVRGAHFDETHAFFNGTSAFLEVVGQADHACSVTILHSDITQMQSWKVATGMPSQNIDSDGFGEYLAEDYDALIDYPVEMGTFTEIDFEACGVPHKMVMTGIFDCDEERLKSDLIKICETEINLFGEPAPVESYLFQVMVTGNDYGGLEHRNSTALICGRNDLPYHGMTEATDGYLQFLELCSHEYFHTWNVKRIQPKVYQESELQSPVYTNQLWWFEGITSYYDGLILQRAGLIDNKTYLQLLAKQMTRVYRMPGRFNQSVSESSWLTWTKFYQQDENAPNAIISYYTKGSLIALGLDLTIRKQTNNEKSLDDVLLHLWHNFGDKRIGLEDGQIEQICSDVSGLDLSDFFERYLFGTEDIPFENLFVDFGIEFSLRQANSLSDLGGANEQSKDSLINNTLAANLVETPQQTLKVTHVWNDQAAYSAGLSAGDEILAINGLKISTKQQLEILLQRQKAGQKLDCHYFRRDELRQCQLSFTVPEKDRVSLIEKTNNTESIQAWL